MIYLISSYFFEAGITSSRFEEEILWESKQLGAHSPYALLHTVMYFNTKYFKLKSTDDHIRLSFNHMLTVFDRKITDRPDKIGVLRYYPNGMYALKFNLQKKFLKFKFAFHIF